VVNQRYSTVKKGSRVMILFRGRMMILEQDESLTAISTRVARDDTEHVKGAGSPVKPISGYMEKHTRCVRTIM
jgi:hypothetical protein